MLVAGSSMAHKIYLPNPQLLSGSYNSFNDIPETVPIYPLDLSNPISLTFRMNLALLHI